VAAADFGALFWRPSSAAAAAMDLSHLFWETRSRCSRERKALKTESKNFMVEAEEVVVGVVVVVVVVAVVAGCRV